MKRIFYIVFSVLAISLLLAACGTRSARDTNGVNGISHADTVGLAEFQEWKTHNERVAAVEAYMKKHESDKTAASPRYASSRQGGSMRSMSENQAKVASKKGWSKAAKGAAIGAGSGAVLGAVINKRNRAAGAVIGGVIGGGVGYGVGRSMDKKDGRY